MHDRGGEERKKNRHMWTTSTRGNPVVSASTDISSSSLSANSFCKDGRKISVGDCALFKPAKVCPPFVGIIRSLTIGKENKLKLGVNWLYRPAEVKLGKGVLLDTAPNEVFYSFHTDEIPTASLLHPCKVAFLPKGVELPSEVSSFVCRRVYDIANKCLWWLTDQDYVEEHQEEVDKLLHRTHTEMHATVQPGGRSPKPMSSPTSISQLKSGSDCVQNSASSFPPQGKVKKRERMDQGSEPVKRTRTTKTEDGDPSHFRQDSILKSEIAKITEKGGLADTEGVEKLVQLMVPDKNEKKIDLASRSMLASVIAATDKFDCLSQFVQLRGLAVFDEWLQEVHKGKIGDGDKSIEEFILILLQALDKLPVNLQALQTCHIGKSVNHLRSNRNSEIQKKSRSLVDTWKKRVEVEWNMNDAKTGSGQAVPWSARTRLPEVAQSGNRHSGGSSDVAMKSSVTQVSASKTASVKIVQGEITRSASTSVSPGSMKSVPSPASATVNLKDGQPCGAAASRASDLPTANARDEKSSSSSQSHNNSQSCSSDHAKNGGFSGKEDARSSTAMSVNKVSGSSSRHRKSINGFPGSNSSGGQRETVSSRSSSLHKNSISEKLSQSGLACEKALDGPPLEGNAHKLVVKIPNRGRSPAQSASGGSFDDPSIMNSRASSPVLPKKPDQFEHSSKEKSDFFRANIGSDINTESWQSNDFKDILTGSDEGDGSPAAVTHEEHCRVGDDSKKISEVSKTASSSSGNENKTGNLRNASFNSINALIESCVKYSEGNASISIVDDVGMNLLASVAAGEISKSELASPAGSPDRNTATVEQSCSGDTKFKSSEEDLARDECHSNDGPDDEHKRQGISGDLGAKNDDNDSGILLSVGKAPEGHNKHIDLSTLDMKQGNDICSENKGKQDEKSVSASLPTCPESTIQEANDSCKQLKEKIFVGVNDSGNPDVKVSDVSSEIEMEGIEKASSCPTLEVDVKVDNSTTEGLSGGGQTAQKPPSILKPSNSEKGVDENVPQPSAVSVEKLAKDLNEWETGKSDDVADQNPARQFEKQRNKWENDSLTMHENGGIISLGSGVAGHAAEYVEENSETREVNDAGQVLRQVSPDLPSRDMDKCLGSKGSKLTPMEAEEAEECTSTTADASSMSAAGVSDMDAKVEFDLNEGFNADDGKCSEFNSIPSPGCATAVRLISPVPFPASSLSGGIPASITVAAAAKGPFLPPEDLLKSKGELGWRGSAATSAFRPAEPRKVVEMPLGTPTTPIPDAAAGKQSRPQLDIDLNVADERILDDIVSPSSACKKACVPLAADVHEPSCNKTIASSPVRCLGGLGLDLNQVDEASDVGNCSTSNSHKMDEPLLWVKSPSGGPPNNELCIRRDFDLNDGPVVDEVGTESSLFPQHGRSNMASHLPVSGLRMSNAELGNLSWFPSTGNTYSAVTISSIMPDRGDQPFSIVTPNGPQRILGPATGGGPFGHDVYRGPVLSSSPAVPYPSAPFQYPVFPFNSSFPLPSAAPFSGGSTTYVDSTSGGRLCFPGVNSQLIGSAGTVSSQFARPYNVGLTDGSDNSSAESNRKWGRQGLDLNTGPGVPDIEGRDENSPFVPRQLSVTSSQVLAEEQARMFQLAGGIPKRKEPDNGWESYKQPSWH